MRVGKLSPFQIQHLVEIGAFLQQVREEQGMSLEQITAMTYVPLRTLRALEAGQVEILPEAVFIQGFIRRYADALGMDGIAVAKQFPVNPAAVDDQNGSTPPSRAQDSGAQDSGAAEPEPLPAATPAAAISTSSPPASSSVRGGRRSARRSATSLNLSWLVGGGLVLMAIVAIGIVVSILTRPASQLEQAQSPESSEPVEPSSPSDEAAIAPADPSSNTPENAPGSDAPTPAASPSPTPAASPSPNPATPIAVTLNITEPAWVSVVVDGQVSYEGTIAQGTERRWEAKQELTVVTGNAGGVRLSFNGGTATPMGARGQVAEVTYTPSGAATTSAAQ